MLRSHPEGIKGGLVVKSAAFGWGFEGEYLPPFKEMDGIWTMKGH